ncbi:hypothetical protein SAMN06297280_1548 [Arsukibacterium tuosuense]|uniref:Ankyrin repeat domain-containing protein n=1 Tax=Arsukibacterium tuosuense TaxID=1323745 RepID=A0A285IPA1_9GAMM|nr:hypothetical protein [Arsukibacterium tuosuense]SNY49802.1 hypothetical protein SAMN06297280_1548 [Arsukibacterium tuosuense]
MTSEHSGKSNHSIAHYAALKTAVANGEEARIKELLTNQTMQPLEKGYLLDLARLGNNRNIISLLEAVPERED